MSVGNRRTAYSRPPPCAHFAIDAKKRRAVPHPNTRPRLHGPLFVRAPEHCRFGQARFRWKEKRDCCAVVVVEYYDSTGRYCQIEKKAEKKASMAWLLGDVPNRQYGQSNTLHCWRSAQSERWLTLTRHVKVITTCRDEASKALQ